MENSYDCQHRKNNYSTFIDKLVQIVHILAYNKLPVKALYQTFIKFYLMMYMNQQLNSALKIIPKRPLINLKKDTLYFSLLLTNFFSNRQKEDLLT